MATRTASHAQLDAPPRERRRVDRPQASDRLTRSEPGGR